MLSTWSICKINLLYDRGTHYGLQSGRRIESVLAYAPIHFEYDRIKNHSDEAKLQYFFNSD